MAQRITIPVLGGTLAPYGSHGPRMQTGNISENQHYDVIQLGKGVDTTAAVRAIYPNALSMVRVTQQAITVGNRTKATTLYLAITSAALDALAS